MGVDDEVLGFHTQLEAAMGGLLRADVVWQVFNSIAHQPIRHAAFVPAGRSRDGVVSGTLLLFTASTVAFVELTDAPWNRTLLATQWSAAVEVRPRTTLTAVRVRGAELLGARDNSLAPHRLSATSVVELTYRGRQPLAVDRDAVAGPLDDLLAAALDDLAASAPPVRE